MKLPRRIRKGGMPLAEDWNNMVQVLEEVARLIPTPSKSTQQAAQSIPPFWPFLNFDGSDYKIRVGAGYVIEHKQVAGADCIDNWTPTGMTSGGAPVAHTIAAGQSAYIKVETTSVGTITAASLVIMTSGQASSHWTNAAGGILYYEIAACVTSGSAVTLTPKLIGSHIDHYADPIRSTHGLDLTVTEYDFTGTPPTEISSQVLCWRFGEFVGSYAVGSEPPAWGNTMTYANSMAYHGP